MRANLQLRPTPRKWSPNPPPEMNRRDSSFVLAAFVAGNLRNVVQTVSTAESVASVAAAFESGSITTVVQTVSTAESVASVAAAFESGSII